MRHTCRGGFRDNLADFNPNIGIKTRPAPFPKRDNLADFNPNIRIKTRPAPFPTVDMLAMEMTRRLRGQAIRAHVGAPLRYWH